MYNNNNINNNLNYFLYVLLFYNTYRTVVV
jgi:hypothetical protein